LGSNEISPRVPVAPYLRLIEKDFFPPLAEQFCKHVVELLGFRNALLVLGLLVLVPNAAVPTSLTGLHGGHAKARRGWVNSSSVWVVSASAGQLG